LPDFYDTDYDDGSSKGTGEWNIMAYGGYLDEPASMSPWSKGYLGWLNDENFLQVEGDEFFSLVRDDATLGYRYYLMPLTDEEYFMIENRHVHELMNEQDAGGVLIWHVDEKVMDEQGTWNGCSGTRWFCNAVNGDARHKMLDLEEADGKEELDGDRMGDKDDPWFERCTTLGGCRDTLFYSESFPDSLAYGVSESDVVLSVNSDVGTNMEVGASLSGVILAPEGVGVVQDKKGSNLWLYIIIGVLSLVVLIVVIFVVVHFMKGKEGEITPSDYKEFDK